MHPSAWIASDQVFRSPFQVLRTSARAIRQIEIYAGTCVPMQELIRLACPRYCLLGVLTAVVVACRRTHLFVHHYTSMSSGCRRNRLIRTTVEEFTSLTSTDGPLVTTTSGPAWHVGPNQACPQAYRTDTSLRRCGRRSPARVRWLLRHGPPVIWCSSSTRQYFRDNNRSLVWSWPTSLPSRPGAVFSCHPSHRPAIPPTGPPSAFAPGCA